jgi:hypothetical protein
MEVDRFSENLRLFFGTLSLKVWGLCRDRQRLQRGREVYSKVIDELQRDLAKEKADRGSLVRSRSLAVTHLKDKVALVEAQHKTSHANVLKMNAQLGSFFGLAELTVKSIFGKSPSVEEYRETKQAEERVLLDSDHQLEKLRTELKGLIYRQMAAVDPIRDLEFALSKLTEEMDSSATAIREINSQLSTLISQYCVSLTPNTLELIFRKGLAPENIYDFSRLVFSFQKNQNFTPIVLSGNPKLVTLEDVCPDNIGRRSIHFSKAVPISGHGDKHKRVGSGKNRRWKSVTGELRGTATVALDVDYSVWHIKSSALSIQNSFEQCFKQAFNQERHIEGSSNVEASVEELLALLA